MSDRTQVQLLLDLLDSAFQRPVPGNWSDGWHSLLSNLQHVKDEDWNWLPADGKRSIRHLAAHAGVCMLVYSGHGFGVGLMQWPDKYPAESKGSKDEIVVWLVECYETLRAAVAAFTDDQLGDPRETWDEGDFRPRRWFITTMIEHILYHSGEINHIRALAQKNDE